MQVAGCNCTGREGNSGFPSTLKPFGRTVGYIKVPLTANDGTRNGLDLAAGNMGTQLFELINNADPSKRGYPYLNLQNVTINEADPTYQTSSSSERFLLRRSIKTITAEVWNVTEQYYDKVNSACNEFGLLQLDECGNVKGQKEGTMLYPRPVNEASFFSKFIDATDEAGTKVMFEMDYRLGTNDGDQWMIKAEEIEADGYSANDLKGMIDVYFTIGAITATTVVVTAYTGYGSATEPIPYEGGSETDFSLYNETTDLPIALGGGSVVESGVTAGEYTITFAAQTAADVISVDNFRQASGNFTNGYEGTAVTFVAV